jgi:hypothetical protein
LSMGPKKYCIGLQNRTWKSCWLHLFIVKSLPIICAWRDNCECCLVCWDAFTFMRRSAKKVTRKMA